MFKQIYQSDNKKFCLYITIKCKGKKKFRVWAEDYGKRNSKYADREITVDGDRTIHFSFPISPKELFIGVLNSQDYKDTNYEVSIIEGNLKDYDIWMDKETKNFVKLALYVSQVSGFTQPPKIFKTDDGKFNIRYFDVIRNADGNPISTPARIGHNTGMIDIAKYKFDKYTIPMRFVILLHEFSHKYKNPKIGLEISNEIGADINALYIYLGLGFSKIDAICVFANVFLKAQTKGNIERIRKITDYIQRFENQEYAVRY